MKIGIAYPEYSRRKGIERHSAELADRAAASGHSVHYYCSRIGGDPAGPVTFHRIPALGPTGFARLYSFALLARRQLHEGRHDITVSYCNVVGCDVIVAQSCHRAGMVARVSAAERRMIRQRNWGLSDRVRLWLEHENYTGRRYKRIISVSAGVKRELEQYYHVPPADVEVIPNGVDLDEFNPVHRNTSGREVRKSLLIEAHESVVLFVSNEFDRKGLEFLIRSLPLLRDTAVRVLVLGGDNPHRYRVLARRLGVEGQLIFSGNVDDISRYYAAADVFVLPTYYEAFSLATLEAAAAGLPLLVTRVNGTDEILREGSNGYFIERDPDDVAGKIRRVLGEIRAGRPLGAHARVLASSYSWDAVMRRLLASFAEVA